MATSEERPAANYDPLRGLTRREFVMQGDVEWLERMRKRGYFYGHTIDCDEPVPFGDGTAPKPLDYFMASILF
jgi:hypothetical protein